MSTNQGIPLIFQVILLGIARFRLGLEKNWWRGLMGKRW